MKNVLKYFGEGTKLAVIVILFFFIGNEIDKELDTKFVAVSLSATVIIFSLYHLVKKIS